MKGVEPANTKIRLPDDRVGTICWNHLDGCGGVWGIHDFSKIEEAFSDKYPAPEFMLREKDAETVLRRTHGPQLECVGDEYEVLDAGRRSE